MHTLKLSFWWCQEKALGVFVPRLYSPAFQLQSALKHCEGSQRAWWEAPVRADAHRDVHVAPTSWVKEE